MEHRRGIVNACGAASAAGLSLILLWCTLMGHTPGFLLSSLGLAEWVNPIKNTAPRGTACGDAAS